MFFRRVTIVALMLITGLSLTLGDLSFTGVYGAETPGSEEAPVVLEVYYQDDSNKNQTLIKQFTKDELATLADGTKYKYSAFNTYPTFKTVEEAYGPTLKGVIDEALKEGNVVGIESSSDIGSDCRIEFKATDGLTCYFTKAQLLEEERYYYPNASDEKYRKGQMAKAYSYEGRTRVPTMINLNDRDQENYGKLVFGQIAPNEQNFSAFVKNMIGGTTTYYDADGNPIEISKKGKIVIHSDSTESWKPIEGTKSGDTEVPVGGIELYREVNGEIDTASGNRYWLYYTVDGSEPTMGSNLYNYNNNGYGTPGEKLNMPNISQPGEILNLKVRVYGYGRPESEIAELTFKGKELGRVNLKSIAATNYYTIKLLWNKVEAAEGYEIYRSESNNRNYKKLVTLDNPDTSYYYDKKCTTGKRYYYKIRAFTDLEQGDYSSEKYATPMPGKTSITSLSSGKRYIKIRWSKTSGASGYKIYRSTKKTSGFKAIKTITKGSTVSYTNKKLKKGKRYYYKIKTYRKVNGKTYYSGYSSVKSAKAR